MTAIKDLHEEKLFLYTMVRLYKPETIVEVGVSQGKSALAIAMALRDNHQKDKIPGRLKAVDDWSRAHGGKAGSKKPAFELLKKDDVARYVDFISSDSQTFLKGLDDNSVDMIHVDADHSFEMAHADTMEAMRAATKLVLVHDTSNLSKVGDACIVVGSWLVDVEARMFVTPMRGYWIANPKSFIKPRSKEHAKEFEGAGI